MRNEATQGSPIPWRQHRDHRRSNHCFGLRLILLVSRRLGHYLRERFMVGDFMVSNLIRGFLRAFGLLELLLLELLSQFRLLELLLFELMSQFRLLELLLFELLS